jgi:hypothetical protein
MPEDESVLVMNATSRRLLSRIDCGDRPYEVVVP